MKPEYQEGKEAKDKFENAMKSLFQLPKVTPKKKQAKKPATLRKSKNSDKD